MISESKICYANQFTIGRMQRESRYEITLHPAFLNRGARPVYRVFDQSAISLRINYEMKVFSKHKASTGTLFLKVKRSF